MTHDQVFILSFFNDVSAFFQPSEAILKDLIQIKETLLLAHYNQKKTTIVGNGGSAAIASHVSVDLTKNCGIRCVNFNEANLITCFGNDFGYAHWVEEAILRYGDPGDVLIAISSSGKSENILNACEAARKRAFQNVITLSGFSKDNPLRKLGDINLWADSQNYNVVETVHQTYLLSVVEMLMEKPS